MLRDGPSISSCSAGNRRVRFATKAAAAGLAALLAALAAVGGTALGGATLEGGGPSSAPTVWHVYMMTCGVPRCAVRAARPGPVRAARSEAGMCSSAPPGASCPVPLARTARRRLARVARTHSTMAPRLKHTG